MPQQRLPGYVRRMHGIRGGSPSERKAYGRSEVIYFSEGLKSCRSGRTWGRPRLETTAGPTVGRRRAKLGSPGEVLGPILPMNANRLCGAFGAHLSGSRTTSCNLCRSRSEGCGNFQIPNFFAKRSGHVPGYFGPLLQSIVKGGFAIALQCSICSQWLCDYVGYFKIL